MNSTILWCSDPFTQAARKPLDSISTEMWSSEIRWKWTQTGHFHPIIPSKLNSVNAVLPYNSVLKPILLVRFWLWGHQLGQMSLKRANRKPGEKKKQSQASMWPKPLSRCTLSSGVFWFWGGSTLCLERTMLGTPYKGHFIGFPVSYSRYSHTRADLAFSLEALVVLNAPSLYFSPLLLRSPG